MQSYFSLPRAHSKNVLLQMPRLIGPGSGREQAGDCSSQQSAAPESPLANCFVRDGPRVTPRAHGSEGQESKAEETGGSKGKVKYWLSRRAINQGPLERPRSSSTERSDMFMPQMKKVRSPNPGLASSRARPWWWEP